MGFLDPIADLFATILAFFYDIVPNLGISIILLTILINLLMFPLVLKQTRSMRAMQEIQPEIKRLQKEHKGDRETLNTELMALYKERGVNPAAGCLPLIIQLPIWFALFRMLRNPEDYVESTSELGQALVDGSEMFLGMNLLVSPSQAVSADGILESIPYLIAIVVVMATGYWQQRQTMARTNRSGAEQTQQQQTMQNVMKVFPLFFGFISWTMPSGLVVYFAASQIVRIGQQSFIIRLDDRHAAERAAEEERARKKKSSTTRSEDSEPSALTAREAEPEPPASKAQPGSRKRKKKRRRN